MIAHSGGNWSGPGRHLNLLASLTIRAVQLKFANFSDILLLHPSLTLLLIHFSNFYDINFNF